MIDQLPDDSASTGSVESSNRGRSAGDSGSTAVAPMTFYGVRKHWMLFNVVFPLAISLLGIVVFLAFGKLSPPIKPPIDSSYAGRVKRLPGVETLPVRSIDDVGGELNLSVDGEVVPYREVTLATEVAGQIVYKDPLCKVGSFVEAGQVLIRIDPTDYEKDVERLSRLKEQEYQAIRELDQETTNTERLLEVAKQDLELQERDVARVRALPPGVASQAEIDNVQRARLQALNTKLSLENQLATLRSRRVRLESAEALADTQLELAQINLNRTEIRAPVSGVIYREDAELNSFVQRGQVVVTVEDISKAEVVINLRTDQLFWVLNEAVNSVSGAKQLTSAPGAIVQSTSNDGGATGSLKEQVDVLDSESQVAPNISESAARSYVLPPVRASVDYQIAGRENEYYRWEGKLSRYDGLGVDPTSRTVPVRVVVDAPRGSKLINRSNPNELPEASRMALVRGMFAQVTLHVEPNRPLVVIPAVGLKPGSTGSRVWKFVEDGSVVSLEDDKQDTVGGADAGADAGSSLETTSAIGEETFDPAGWLVGHIDVIEHIRPIEAMSLTLPEDIDGPLAKGPSGKPVYWVCEVGEGSLQPGDRLVVSPLPSFEGGGKDSIRIRKDSSPVAANVDSETVEP